MSSLMTWSMRPRYYYTGGAAINNASTFLTAVNNAITANSVKWVVSSFSGGMLEIKAAGSPAGDLATVRFLLFGGSSPNSGALTSGMAASASNVYAMLSVDANTTGPVQSYTIGNPYTGKTRNLLGVTVSGTFDATVNAFVDIFETDDVLHINVCATGLVTCLSATFGRCVDDPSGVARWAVVTPGTTIPSNGFATGGDTAWHISQVGTGTAATFGLIEIDSSGTVRTFGRFDQPYDLYDGLTDSNLSNGTDAYFIPIYLSRVAAASHSQRTYAGTMRQMKWGPQGLGGNILQVGGQTKAYASAAQGSTACHPIWLTVDQ